jgi:acyl-CoA synthetase (AMP-forming)/AMP-acid ligase II
LASFKRPKRYVFLKTIPVNAMGKVDRNVLKEHFGGRP